MGELELKKLDLSDNQLTALPDSIGDLKELRELYLSNNQLETLPSAVYQLPELMYLTLRGNRITKLPADIGGARYLRQFSADWHLLTSPAIPAHVRQHGDDAVRSFLRSRHCESGHVMELGEHEFVIRVHDPVRELRDSLESKARSDVKEKCHVVVLAHGVRRHDLDTLRAMCKLLMPFTDHRSSAFLEHHDGTRVLAGRAQIARMAQTDAQRTQVLLIGEARAGKTTLSMQLQGQPPAECIAPKPRTRGVVHHEVIKLDGMEGFAFLVEFGGQHEYRHSVPLFVGGSTLHVVVVRTQHEDGSDRSFEEMSGEVEEFLHLTALRHTSSEGVLAHINTLFPAEEGAEPVADADVWNDRPAVVLVLNGPNTKAAKQVKATFHKAAEGTHAWQQCVQVVGAVAENLHTPGVIHSAISTAILRLEHHRAQRASLLRDVLAVRRAVETIAARDMADRIVGDDEHRAAPFMRWADLRTQLREDGCALPDARLRACMWALYQNTEVLARRCTDCTWVCIAPQWLFDAVAICIPHDDRGDAQHDGALSGRAQLVAELAARMHVADDGMTLHTADDVLRHALRWLATWGFAVAVQVEGGDVHATVPLRAAHAPPPTVLHMHPVAKRVITFTHTSMGTDIMPLRVPGYLERTVALVFRHFVNLRYDVNCSGHSLVMHGTERDHITVELGEPDTSSREFVLRVSSRSQGDAALDDVRQVLHEMLHFLRDVPRRELWALEVHAVPPVAPLPLGEMWEHRGEAGDTPLAVLGEGWTHKLFAILHVAPDMLVAGPDADRSQRTLRVLGVKNEMLRVVPIGGAKLPRALNVGWNHIDMLSQDPFRRLAASSEAHSRHHRRAHRKQQLHVVCVATVKNGMVRVVSNVNPIQVSFQKLEKLQRQIIAIEHTLHMDPARGSYRDYSPVEQVMSSIFHGRHIRAACNCTLTVKRGGLYLKGARARPPRELRVSIAFFLALGAREISLDGTTDLEPAPLGVVVVKDGQLRILSIESSARRAQEHNLIARNGVLLVADTATAAEQHTLRVAVDQQGTLLVRSSANDQPQGMLGVKEGMLHLCATTVGAVRVWAVTTPGAVHELELQNLGTDADEWCFVLGDVRPHALVVCSGYGVHAQLMPATAVREVHVLPRTAASGAERDEHTQNDHDDGMLRVVFLCDEWLSAKGGVSTINSMVIDALLDRESNIVVTCLLPESAEGVPENEGKYAGVFIRLATAPGERFEVALLTQHITKPARVDFVVGHMGVTSKAAAWLAKLWGTRHAHFVHVLPEHLPLYKDGQQWGAGEAKKRAAVAQLTANTGRWDEASLVVSVGPRLEREWKNAVRPHGITVTRIDPWLPHNKPLDSIPSDELLKGELMLRGRMQHLRQKGLLMLLSALDKAANKSAESKRNLKRAPLVLRGVYQHEWDTLVEMVEWNYFTDVKPRPYTTHVERLKEDLHSTQLLCMPSRAEAFGLVALEALAAGRAVLVSEDSGFAELLQEDNLMRELSECCMVSMPPHTGRCVDNLTAWLFQYFTDEPFRAKVQRNAVALRARYATVVSKGKQMKTLTDVLHTAVKET